MAVPDLSLGDVWGAKVAAAIPNGRAEGPSGLEWREGTGRILSRDKAGKEDDDSDEGGERTHFHRDRRITQKGGSDIAGI